MSTPLSSLSAAVDERKARLSQLRNLKRKQPADEVAPPESTRSPSPPQEPDVSKLHLSGRNYDPETRGPKLGFDAPPTLGLEKPTLEDQAAEVEAEIREKAAEDENDDKGIDLFKLQPKKPNWDLKRDLDKKMQILNTKTDNAIAKLVRDRIKAQELSNKSKQLGNNEDGEAIGVDGVALVEGLKVREREEEEELRRENEDDDLNE
jgi:coiled-coil domain-containing protein 12